MKDRHYYPIITYSTQYTFFDYIDSLDIPQLDYFAIGLQNKVTHQSISLMSRPEWQQEFVDQQYAQFDPIRKATLHTARTFIPFQEIDHLNSFGGEIMRRRAKMEIKDGIVLMQRHDKYNYMITLGTGYSKFDACEFLRRYQDKIILLKSDLIKIIHKDTKQFLPTSFYEEI